MGRQLGQAMLLLLLVAVDLDNVTQSWTHACTDKQL